MVKKAVLRPERGARARTRAEEAARVRVPRPEQAARHAHVGERLADALRPRVVQHLVDGVLGAAELLVDVLRTHADILVIIQLADCAQGTKRRGEPVNSN